MQYTRNSLREQITNSYSHNWLREAKCYGQLKKTTTMKKLLLLNLILLTLFAKGQTSAYHSFPDSNAVWNFHFQHYCFFNGTGDEYYSITFSSDTLINSQTYHKLTTPFVQSFSTGTCGGIPTGYKGAIRQDTANKKVFYIPPTDTTEQLLYDFTMQVGDTVRGYIETFAFTTDIVQSIDSVLIGSTYRKRWNINNCYNIQFIEGIGSTYGLFERSPGCITDDAGYSLTCFQQNGQSLYPDTITNCQLITSVNSIDNFSNQIKIFPNPSSSSFTVDFDNADIKEIKLTDLLGNTIFQQQTNKQSQIKIDRLQIGTYILTIIDRKNRTTNRKIISCP